MSAKNEQLVRLIEAIVRKEVARIAPTIIKETMAKVMGNMILEAADSIDVSAAPVRSNSHKRTSLQEQMDVGYEDYETMGGGISTTATGMRAPASVANRMPQNRAGGAGRITIDAFMTENGTPISISPTQVPAVVDAAMNKDYRELLKRTLIGGLNS